MRLLLLMPLSLKKQQSLFKQLFENLSQKSMLFDLMFSSQKNKSVFVSAKKCAFLLSLSLNLTKKSKKDRKINSTKPIYSL